MKTKQLDNLKEGDAVVFIKQHRGLYNDADPIDIGDKLFFCSLHKMEPMSASIIYFSRTPKGQKIAFSPMSLSKYIQPLAEKRNEILNQILS